MAYQDPYAGQYGHSQYAPQQPSYAQHQPPYYNEPAEYDPYTTSEGHQPHATYDNYGGAPNYGGGYQDEPYQDTPGPQRQGSGYGEYRANVPPPLGPPKALDETSAFDHGEFSPRGPKTASAMRQYRRDFQGNLWTRGGGASCFFRFFCCTFLILVFLIVTILLSIVLWLRPPSLDFGDVSPSASSQAIQFTGDTITVNMGVNISVQNPNFFNVNFKKINAEIFYPLNGNLTQIGNGTTGDTTIHSNSETNFTFPFTFAYSTAIDPGNHILIDIGSRCGVIGTKEPITVDYTITLGVQILFVTISPKIHNSFTFDCPLDADELKNFLASILGNLGSLGSLLGSL